MKAIAIGFMGAMLAVQAQAAELKVLSAGAFKQVVAALAPSFEQQSGNRLAIENDTVGALVKRIEGGESFDVAFLSPSAVRDLIARHKIAEGSSTNVARVGIGVMVREGARKPDIATVDAFKQAVLAARSVAYIDPASGGSSGVYLAELFEKMGIAADVRPKAKLKQGGYVADLLVSGDAELGIHQISEIIPAKGVTLVGPLPAEIQNYTVYAAGISAASPHAEAAKALIRLLTGPEAATVLRQRGMEPPPS